MDHATTRSAGSLVGEDAPLRSSELIELILSRPAYSASIGKCDRGERRCRPRRSSP